LPTLRLKAADRFMPQRPEEHDEPIEQALSAVQTRDRHRLGRRVARARSAEERAAVQAKLETRAQQTQARLAARGLIELTPDLPINQRAKDIARAVATHQVVVVCGETGSGKTTQLPKILMQAGLGARGRIGHTQPRRLAARSVAARI